ncbi:hypothetical protein LAZ67_8002228 [Cordylochernes scorpioides]|uniref:Uncharacterized protein n=1 Tax=Cordylochernes scorpioides TaxID=51811 RepID=A0ABY6KQS6_9ARAC|nr:hypothetical protein LAZ67_8002228 [Cordylochernes scorpioides]
MCVQMKLIKWVEVHIGRRRAKKDCGERTPEPSPAVVKRLENVSNDSKRAMHIRTSFLETAPVSPRQRSRIRTNPWLPRGPEGTEPMAVPTLEEEPSSPLPALRSGLKRSDWINFQEVAAAWAKEAMEQEDIESSDEAYSEDYIQSEDPGTPSDAFLSKEVGSPQADSACGSCSTTPMSENGPMPRRQSTLALKMEAARAEDQDRIHSRIRLQSELAEYRRMMLVHTLRELRRQLEGREAMSNTTQWLEPLT